MADTDSTAEAVNSKTEAEPEDGDSNAEAEPPCKRARSDDDDEDDADSNDQNGKCKPVPKPVTPGLTLEGTNVRLPVAAMICADSRAAQPPCTPSRCRTDHVCSWCSRLIP